MEICDIFFGNSQQRNFYGSFLRSFAREWLAIVRNAPLSGGFPCSDSFERMLDRSKNWRRGVKNTIKRIRLIYGFR